jgi:membrane protein DedA with SNARE-associated domain
MENDIFEKILTYGYVIVFLYSLGGGFVALLAASILASIGKLDIYQVFIAAFTGNLIGDTLIFYFSRNNKKDILSYLKKYKKEVALSHLLLKKYGYLVIIVQKYIQGVRTLIPVIIGMSNYSFKKFTFFNIVGAFLWTLIFSILGLLLGQAAKPFIFLLAEKPWLMIFIGLFFILTSYIIIKLIIKRR